jgi:hypothetical protein
MTKLDWLIGWLYCFTSLSRNFHSYGDVTITGDRLQNLGLCSALRAIEQGGIFIMPHLLWYGASVFPVSSERPSICRLLQHARGCWGPILTRNLIGPQSVLVTSYSTQGDAENVLLHGLISESLNTLCTKNQNNIMSFVFVWNILGMWNPTLSLRKSNMGKGKPESCLPLPIRGSMNCFG